MPGCILFSILHIYLAAKMLWFLFDNHANIGKNTKAGSDLVYFLLLQNLD
jgi:hypothetical protein